MYPAQKELSKKWWHRLANVLFILVTIIVVIISAYTFYMTEESNATKYKIIKNLNEYAKETKNDFDKGFSSPRGAVVSDLTSFRPAIKESFISQYDLEGLLGCLNSNQKVEYLSEFDFEQNISCNLENGDCIVPQSICGGDASKIVKYQSEIRYSFQNYFFIILKTLVTLVLWLFFGWLLYYKGLLYIIYGNKNMS